MTIKELQEIAKKKKVIIKNLKRKADIIKTIQRAEGSFDCFGTATTGVCSQTRCLWRDDCFKASKG
ncbi:MAG: SAP domain-containing protein [Nitrospirae bacterium]|nr:SAP domain-containing protein [Nitrospirota bacterium]